MNKIELPTLTGSEKQIAWAEKLREKAIVELQADMASKQRMIDNADSERGKAMWTRLLNTASELYNELITCTSAAKIISNWR